MLLLLYDCSHGVAISLSLLTLLHLVRLTVFKGHDLDRDMDKENIIFLCHNNHWLLKNECNTLA
jgi:hypothetical protein